MARKNLPSTQPIADGLAIAPESLEIANVYLETGDVNKTAEYLGIGREVVVAVLSKKEVRNFVDTVFLNAGWMSRSKIADALDSIIEKKLKELEEAEIGSSKDIADLLMMAHKMRMEEIEAMRKAGEVPGIKKQVNVQINDGVGGSNYNSLLQKLVSADERRDS